MTPGLVSIFTPSNNSDWLPRIYESLKQQTDDSWEWIILYNNGAVPNEAFKDDPRVKAYYAYSAPSWVGPLKNAACGFASGDYLLELDHDDLLMPTAVAEVRKAFEDPSIGFCYSNTIRCTGDMKPHPRFSEGFGWEYRSVEVQGHKLDEYVAFEPTPASVSKIWFAPDHLRAFRRDLYQAIGGHAKDMRVLDDQDLMCRLYQVTKFKHIDLPLYVYRVHGENAWLKHNDEIQQNVLRLHDKYIEGMAEKWARDSGLRLVEVGGRMNAKEGYETVDLRDCDIVADLNQRWPFDDNSVGCVRSLDVFEHLRDPVHTMKELHRVLAPGGYAFIQVPSTDGRGAFQDPTHVSFWNENAIHYYTDRNRNKYIDCPVRFQALRLYTTEKNSEQVCWTIAHLMKLGSARVPGEVLI